MFKRRKDGSDAEDGVETVVEEIEVDVEVQEAPNADLGLTGPFDISQVPDDGLQRVDLGGVHIPIADRMELQLEGQDEESGNFAAATIVVDDGALQIMAVAAPRSGGFWAEVMDELEEQVKAGGGALQRGEGRFGPELSGNVPVQDPEGNVVTQPARFVGAEGSRWFLRGMFMGTAAVSPARAEFFEDILAGCVVDRGVQPMAPGDLIGLRPPTGMVAEEGEFDDEDELEDQGSNYDDLEPFERGPEITETR